MAQSAQAVADHYGRRALGDVILAALKAAGKDIEHLTPDDLAPVDEFHSGGPNAPGSTAPSACSTSAAASAGLRATSRANSAVEWPASISPKNSSRLLECSRNAPGSPTR